MPPKGSDDSFLVVGAGPAGLECALTLARRGYDVTLAEATETYGGRVERESRFGFGVRKTSAARRFAQVETTDYCHCVFGKEFLIGVWDNWQNCPMYNSLKV